MARTPLLLSPFGLLWLRASSSSKHLTLRRDGEIDPTLFFFWKKIRHFLLDTEGGMNPNVQLILILSASDKLSRKHMHIAHAPRWLGTILSGLASWNERIRCCLILAPQNLAPDGVSFFILENACTYDRCRVQTKAYVDSYWLRGMHDGGVPSPTRPTE